MQLMETLAIVDGVLQNEIYHQQRYQQGMQFLTSSSQTFLLPQLNIPTQFQSGVVRCRLLYDQYQQQYEFFPYTPRQINSYQIIYADDVDYRYKYTDRTVLNQLFAQRGECDEILIIQQGLITDCSIGNVLFLRNGQWFTPQSPLLAGTQRAKLLAEQRIHVAEISIDNIFQFERLMMINALNPFDAQRSIAINPHTIRGIQ